jgi:ribonuclease HI
LELLAFDKTGTAPEVLKNLFAATKANFGDHVEIYTDGSKIGETVGCAAICEGHVKNIRLPDKCNIYTAELHAIRMALDIIRRSRQTSFVIYSDSLSSLQAIQHFLIENEIILDILKVYTQLVHSQKRTILCWVPSHVGIPGNEKADTAAKASLGFNSIANCKIPAENYYPHVNRLCMNEWQQSWNNQPNNKLHSVMPLVGKTVNYRALGRREQTVITRLRIGHTRLTHSYLLSKDSQPECSQCKCHLSVKHLLLECSKLASIRRKYYSCSTMKELFEDIDFKHIIDFTKEAKLYHHI